MGFLPFRPCRLDGLHHLARVHHASPVQRPLYNGHGRQLDRVAGLLHGMYALGPDAMFCRKRHALMAQPAIQYGFDLGCCGAVQRAGTVQHDMQVSVGQMAKDERT